MSVSNPDLGQRIRRIVQYRPGVFAGAILVLGTFAAAARFGLQPAAANAIPVQIYEDAMFDLSLNLGDTREHFAQAASPFDIPYREPPVEPEPEPDPALLAAAAAAAAAAAEPEPEPELVIPEFRLNAVFYSPQLPLAEIDGKLHSIGKEVQTGWRIESILHEEVTLVGPGGASLNLSLYPRGGS